MEDIFQGAGTWRDGVYRRLAAAETAEWIACDPSVTRSTLKSFEQSTYLLTENRAADRVEREIVRQWRLRGVTCSVSICKESHWKLSGCDLDANFTLTISCPTNAIHFDRGKMLHDAPNALHLPIT